MRSQIFFSIFTGLMIGMVSGMFVIPDLFFSFSWVWVLLVVVWIMVSRSLFHYKGWIMVTIVFCCSFGIGFLRTHQFHTRYPFSAFDTHHNQKITLVGKVSQPPVFQPGTQFVRIHPETVNGEKMPPITADVIIKVSDLESYSVGDRVVVSGTFTTRENFESDTGRVVHYRLMSYGRKIAGDIRYPTIERFIPGDRSALTVFTQIKKKFIITLNQLYVAPASGLLSGIIIGDTSSLDNNLLDLFRAVGLIHIVVLSGYNITLVANFFVRMFAPLGYYRRLLGAMIALVGFILIVGISPTAMRAGIMALCAFSARYFLRPYIVIRGICLALLIMVWISPYTLLFDLSLQLSFLATIGIVFVFPKLSNRFPILAENSLGEILLQTIAVNILTLPLIIYQIGYFSPISFPVNVLVLGVIPWVTILGFFSVFMGMITIPVGKIVAFPIQIIIDGIIKFVTFIGRHDPFQMVIDPFSWYWLVGIYGVIVWVMLNRWRASR